MISNPQQIHNKLWQSVYIATERKVYNKQILLQIIGTCSPFFPLLESLKCKQMRSNVMYDKAYKVIHRNTVGHLQNMY